MRYLVFDIETTRANPAPMRNINELEIALVGAYDSGTNAYSSYLKDELSRLWPLLERTDLLIGYNSDHFDIPLLNRYYPGDLTTIPSLDLLAEVYKALGRRLRLESLAQATLGRGKKGDGLKAIEWRQAGEVEKVRDYCLEDVRLTKELFDYAREHKLLKYKDLQKVHELKIDTSTWDRAKNAPALTHTLSL